MKRTLALFAAFSLFSNAAADDFDKKIAAFQLLQDKKVQTELKLTEAQRTKLNKHADAFNAKAAAYQKELEAQQKKTNKPAQPDQKRMEAMMTELKGKVLAELSATQMKRLRELSLQAVGVTALGDDLVAARVGLTADQKAKVRTLIKSGLDAANKLMAQADANARKGKKAEETYNKRIEAEQKRIQPQLQKLREDTIKKVLAAMNAKQNAAWKQLQGKPYTG
jgi:hypothetical protein